MSNKIDVGQFENSTSAGGFAGVFSISNETALLALNLISAGLLTMEWFNDDGSEVTPPQRDYIDNVVDTAFRELTVPFEIPIGGEMIVGQVIPLARDPLTIPSNLLKCDGSVYLASAYPELYAVLPDVFILSGTEFEVPNMTGKRTTVHGDDIGTIGGSETHTLTIDEVPAHNHARGLGNSWILDTVFTPGAPEASWNVGVTSGAYASQRAITGNTGGGEAHNNMPPHMIMTYYIVAAST